MPSRPLQESSSTHGRYRIGTAARRAGVTPVDLRNWERRYGLVRPTRGPGGQRLYSDLDVAYLREIRRRLAEGRPIGELAAEGPDRLPGSVDDASEGSPAPGGASNPVGSTRSAQPRAEPESLLAEVVESALELDASRLERALDRAFATFDPGVVVGRVVEPASAHLGELWTRGACSVASEHLASDAFVARLRRLLAASAPDRGDGAPLALTACFPDELHEIGALSVALRLARRGARVVHLGSRLPFEDLETSLEQLEPRWLVLSVMRAETFERHADALLDLAERWRDRLKIAAGGAGISARSAGGLGERGVLLPERGEGVEDFLDRLVASDGRQTRA